MRDDVVHSFVASVGVPAPEFRFVSGEIVIIHFLVNSLALEAGQEVVLHVPEPLIFQKAAGDWNTSAETIAAERLMTLG